MANEKLVTVEQDSNGIAVVKLCRGDKCNALSIALIEQLCDALDKIHSHKTTRVIIVISEGKVFSSGLDLTEVADQALERRSAELIARVLKTLYTSPCVTIAAVQGVAAAGGAGLVAASDYVVMASNAKIGFPEVRRGLVAAQVMTLLARQLKERALKELLLFGELIDAEEAKEIGLVNIIVNEGQLLKTARQYASLALASAPGAVKMTKELIDQLHPRSFAEEIQNTMEIHHAARRSKEAEEGVRAFLEKRVPNWAEGS